jgi:hypothetical protein
VSRARLGALAVLVSVLYAIASSVAAQGQPRNDDRRALIVFVPDASFEDLIANPSVASLARAGGAALLARSQPLVDVLHEGVGAGEVRTVSSQRVNLDILVERALFGLPSDSPDEVQVLVIVLGTTLGDPPVAAEGGIVMGSGGLDELFPETGEQGSLTSDSTRRDGVVIGDDVRATLESFLSTQGGIGGDDPGEPIEIVDGPPPFELYDRYLAQRRMYVPVGTAAALYVTGAGLVAIALLARGERAPTTWRRVAGWASLSVPMLAAGLLATGHLPELSYATAVPMIAIVAVFGTMAFSPLERADVTLVPAGIGVAILVAFALEAASGWSGMLTPLLGGSQLDGGRFYGLPNVAIGLLVGASLWVAHRLSTLAGFALLCGAGLFAGLPFLGVNLGGAVTAFAAAGLWLAVRERDRLGWAKGAAIAVAVTVIGSALILTSHALSPVATHVTRFEESVEGVGGVVDAFLDRLQVGFDLIARSPAALVPVVGLPIALLVVIRPPAAIRATFERWPAWRDAILVTFAAGIIAYIVNDSGPAAAGLAFGLGLGGMIGVSLLASTGKMETA